MKARDTMGVLHSFSIEKFFYNKMDLRIFYFDATNLHDKQCYKNAHEKIKNKF